MRKKKRNKSNNHNNHNNNHSNRKQSISTNSVKAYNRRAVRIDITHARNEISVSAIGRHKEMHSDVAKDGCRLSEWHGCENEIIGARFNRSLIYRSQRNRDRNSIQSTRSYRAGHIAGRDCCRRLSALGYSDRRCSLAPKQWLARLIAARRSEPDTV